MANAGKTAVCTGATSGIGRACAVRLAEAGYSVIAMGRSAQRGKEVVDEMTSRTPAAASSSSSSSSLVPQPQSPKHEFLSCDAFSLANLVAAAERIQSSRASVDVLVMCQGMGTVQGFTPTVDGNDEKLTLHYWGRMALINALLPALRNGGGSSRVISILSGGVHASYPLFETDFELRSHYTLSSAANAAGFYTDLCMDAFACQKANESITFIHSAPGFVNTNWGSEMPWYIRAPVRALQPLLGKSPEKCAQIMLRPVFMSNNELRNGNDAGIVILDEKGQPAKRTDLHTEPNVQMVFKKTAEVLSKAGIVMDAGA